MAAFKEYEEYDGLGLAELVSKGEVTPSELLEACIERIESRNPALNAVVHMQFERARKTAASELPDGPFKGVPFLLKDLSAEQQGEPYTSSCQAFAKRIAPHDAELVARYQKAGVVIAGRTNTPELGIYGVTESEMRGPARNPWNTGHTTGGSSGGSAAAVAARIVPMAHGGDGGGSIRIPSAHCGLFGMKPTRARNPIGPDAGEGWGGLVVEHVLTRSVRDSAAMLDATQGSELGNIYEVVPPERPYREELEREPGQLRIAFTTQSLLGGETHADCVAAVEDAAKLAESLGHEVEEARPEFDQAEMVQAYLRTVAVSVADELRQGGDLLGRVIGAADVETTTWLLKLVGDAVAAPELRTSQNHMHRASRSVARFMQRYDVILTPTAARPPVEIGTFKLTFAEKAQTALLRLLRIRKLFHVALGEMAKGPLTATPNTQLFNMTGQPAMSVPLFWNEAGLPIGTQWAGRFGDEATLYRLAAQLEQARPWKDRVPPIV